MECSSLKSLALTRVTKCILSGKYDNIDYEFDPDISNRIFKYAMFLGTGRGTIRKSNVEQMQSKLNITVADFRCGSLGKFTFDMLKHQNLERLHLAPLINWRKECDDENGNFKIVSFLKNMLNEETNSKLKHLDFFLLKACEPNWSISIGQFLPNLESLDIGFVQLDQNEFQSIFQNFRNLKILKINSVGLNNLRGISNLKNLEIFIARGLEVTTPERLTDLFECKRMKLLDFSRNKRNAEMNIVEVYLSCERVLEELIFFGCRNLDIDEIKLEKLMRTHRNLRQLVVLGTALDYTSVPGIDLLSRVSLESFVNIIKHEISFHEYSFVSSMLNYLNTSFLSLWVNEEDVEGPMLPKISKILSQALDVMVCHTPTIKECVLLSKVITRKSLLKYFAPKDTVTLILALVRAGWFRAGGRMPFNKEIWDVLSQKHLLELPYFPVSTVCWFAVASLNKVKKTAAESKEYAVLGQLIGRMYPEDREEFYDSGYTVTPMISLIRNAYQQPQEWITENGSIIKIAMDVIYEVSKRSTKTCQKLTCFGMMSISIFQILMNLCKDRWVGLPEQVRALEIIINLTKLEDFEEKCGKFLMRYVPVLLKMLKGDTSTVFCSITILSSLIRCKLPKKGFYDFWNKINFRIMTLCSRIQSEHISANLDVFLTSSILRDTFLNSYLDGPKVWALLTMRTMLERDAKIGEKFRENGFFEIVKNYRSKEKKAMNIKMDVMGLMMN